ncbi:cysteine-rich KTR domain-containing protein [Acutalibacter intestini]|uniref:cysteine-rich KTR domain-containing protein n=1 Tax=Acutalibacter intestini TaxID=3093659 RepID=UPI002AC95A7D|nr:cysteine-rich KTR domain-containing protein [Acutalibacter sp. M00204]
MRTEWVRCPVCGARTRDRIEEETILKNAPLYCPKYKQETLIEAKKFQVTVIRKENT